MLKHICNLCGKDFNEQDEQESFGMHYHAGYGSKFDGDTINCDLCCTCFDELMETYILPKSKIHPIEECKWQKHFT